MLGSCSHGNEFPLTLTRARLRLFRGAYFIVVTNCEICVSVSFSIQFNVENNVRLFITTCDVNDTRTSKERELSMCSWSISLALM